MAKKDNSTVSTGNASKVVFKQSVNSGKGILFSRLDYAESYTYNGETCMITPKGKINVDDVSKIGQPLKPGLILRKID